MDAIEMGQAIGRMAWVNQNGLTILVRVENAKLSYGSVRYLVTPVSGTGSVWVDAGRVSFENSQEKGNGQ